MKRKQINNHQAKTLGPISDLERHLPHDWWKTLFNSIYLKTDGDVVESAENTRFETDLVIRTLSLEPNDRILDLCCGQGRHCLELARRGFKNIVGLDRSRYLVRLARKRAKQLNFPIHFHEGDARKFRIPGMSFHCVVLMGNSFGYFDRKEDDFRVLENIKRVLDSRGRLAIDITDGDWMRTNFEKRSWEWIDQNYFVCRERSLSETSSQLITREVVVHAEKGVITDQFYAERLYNKHEIKQLLEELEFINIQFYEEITPMSSRGQDLGMMEHRIFVTAKVPYKSKVASIAKPIVPKNIVVLLGDPRLPDPVKLHGKFNEEDLQTSQRLKDALDELADYRFIYEDNHSDMLLYLMQQRPDFVFNLCDEGYNNDAFKELHIPAILEMLKIPYTGAGPASLGLCYNKFVVRAIAESLDIPVPLETFISTDDHSATLPSIFPALVKPNFGDSSIGITQHAVIHHSSQLVAYIEEINRELPGRPILVQEFLEGNEYTVGIIGNPGFGFYNLPILEVNFSKLSEDLPKILGYESKWDPHSPYWNQIEYQSAQLDEEMRRLLYDYSTILFERLECKDYARFDFRADRSGVIKLLEVNPNPGWCWDGKLNMMAGLDGLRYSDLLRMILEAAFNRYSKNGHS